MRPKTLIFTRYSTGCNLAHYRTYNLCSEIKERLDGNRNKQSVFEIGVSFISIVLISTRLIFFHPQQRLVLLAVSRGSLSPWQTSVIQAN